MLKSTTFDDGLRELPESVRDLELGKGERGLKPT